MELNNNWKDRKVIRNELIYKACLPNRDFTPVLILYWTNESLQQFLVPCTQEELARLWYLNGVDENGPGWEQHGEDFLWLKARIHFTGMTEGNGEWYERYFIDVRDEDGRVLDPIATPPGTAVILTGIITQEKREDFEGRNPIIDLVEMVEKTGGLVRLEGELHLAAAEDTNDLAQSYVLACKHLGREPVINEVESGTKVEP